MKKLSKLAARFKRAESELIAVLQEVDTARVYLDLGYTSLFSYCVQALGLSEAVTSNFVAVSRKAREVPELQLAIQDGSLSVSKARKITPVLTLESPEEWIEKAKTLSSRKLEEEVARILPQAAAPTRLESGQRRSRRIATWNFKIRTRETQTRSRSRVPKNWPRRKSSKMRWRHLLELYLEKKDPLRKAERAQKGTPTYDAPACVTGHVVRPTRSQSPRKSVIRSTYETAVNALS